VLLLRLYLVGEESSEQALQRELRTSAPGWLARQLDQHLADEQLHARLFAEAIAERGGSAQAAASPEEAPRPDWLSRRKLARWQALIRRHAPHFTHGGLVPAYAIGLCAEQMASRILQRHTALIGPRHALHPLLARVMADEERHVRLCSRTLQRCVAPQERPRLARLMREVRDTERGFGITGAIGMLAAGLALRLRPGAAPMPA
jgi:ATP-dependent exoDNAse (exonuclease V) beta subunit